MCNARKDIFLKVVRDNLEWLPTLGGFLCWYYQCVNLNKALADFTNLEVLSPDIQVLLVRPQVCWRENNNNHKSGLWLGNRPFETYSVLKS